MFAPMSPMTERVRIQNERLLAQQLAAPFALPKVKLAPLSKLFRARRSEQVSQPRTVAECCSYA